MGNDSSPPWQTQYQPIQTITPNYSIIRNRIKPSLTYQLRSFHITPSQQSQLSPMIQTRLNDKNMYIQNLIRSYKKHQFTCGSGMVYQFIYKQSSPNLVDHCRDRRKRKERFQVEEIVYVIRCVYKGLVYLKKINQKHGNISLSNIIISSKQIYLKDPILLSLLPIQTSNPTLQPFLQGYPSPQKLKQSYDMLINLQQHTSDLYSLGIVALQMYYLDRNLNEIYQGKNMRYRNCRISYEMVDQMVEGIKERELKEMIRVLVEKEGKERGKIGGIVNGYGGNVGNLKLLKRSPLKERPQEELVEEIQSYKDSEEMNQRGFGYGKWQGHLPGYKQQGYPRQQPGHIQQLQQRNDEVYPQKQIFLKNQQILQQRQIQQIHLDKYQQPKHHQQYIFPNQKVGNFINFNRESTSIIPISHQYLTQQPQIYIPPPTTQQSRHNYNYSESNKIFPIYNPTPFPTFTTPISTSPQLQYSSYYTQTPYNTQQQYKTSIIRQETQYPNNPMPKIQQQQLEKNINLSSLSESFNRLSSNLKTLIQAQELYLSSSKKTLITIPTATLPETKTDTQIDPLPKINNLRIKKASSLYIQTVVPIIPQVQQQHSNLTQNQFVIQQYQIGTRYQGSKRNGKRNGTGKFYYSQGSCYDGEWLDNKMHGFGILTYPNGTIAYQGEWAEDEFQGKGILYNSDPIPIINKYDYKNMRQIQNVWIMYQGQMHCGMRHGYGKLTLINGERYQGKFYDDQIHGDGIFYRLDGEIIRGRWKHSILQVIYSSSK